MGEIFGYTVLIVGGLVLATIALPLLRSFVDEVVLHPEHSLRSMSAADLRWFLNMRADRNSGPLPEHWLQELPEATVWEFCGEGRARQQFNWMRNEHTDLSDTEYADAFYVQITPAGECIYGVKRLPTVIETPFAVR